MSLFRNVVGRPSNDTLKKRKLYRIILLILTVVFVLGSIFLLFETLFPVIGTYRQASSNVDSSKMSIQITSVNSTRSLLIGTKRYLSGTWIPQKTVGSNTVFANSDGKTKMAIKTTFSRSYFDSMVEKGYAFWVVAYNRYGRRVSSSTLTQMNEDDFTAVKDTTVKEIVEYTKTINIKIDSSVKYIRVIVQDPTKSTPTHYIQINTAVLPKVTLKSTSGKANSKGIVSATKAGKEYNTIVTINNPSRATLWYRWVKYNNHTLTNPDSFDCKKITSTKVVTRGLYVTESVPQRAGYVRVYTTEAACKSDSKLNKKNDTTGDIQSRVYVATGTIKYELAKTYNAGNNWKRIRFDYNDLKNKIGKQAPGICFNYALSYGTYIKNSNGTYTKPATNYEGNYGAKSSYASSYYKMYTAIKSKIDAGIPVSIHVGNKTSSHHWVLVTGYKTGGTSTKIKNGSNLRNYLYVLDPYDLSHGQMSSDNQAAWFYGDMRYITW